MSTGDWLSLPAVRWAINDAPDVPAHALAVLMAIAKHADANGRGSHPGMHRLAWYTRKSEDQVKRDIRVLRKCGLIRDGDPQLVQHLRADKRPPVYDLAMERCRPAYRPKDDQTSEARGRTRTPVNDEREGTHAPPQAERGCMCASAGGRTCMSGGACTPPEEGFEKDRKKPSSLTPAEQAIADVTDATPEERREMIDLIIQEWDVRAPDAYIPQMKSADLSAYLTRVRARHVTTPTPEPVTDVFARHRALAAPQPRDDEQPPPADQSIAALRARIGSRRAEHPQRPRPLTTPPKAEDPVVQAAYDRLNQCGDYDRRWTAARQQLGTDAHRDEVALLADQLAHSAPLASA